MISSGVVHVLPYGARPKFVLGTGVQLDQLQAIQTERLLQGFFPRHDIVILGGVIGMAEVAHG